MSGRRPVRKRRRRTAGSTAGSGVTTSIPWTSTITKKTSEYWERVNEIADVFERSATLSIALDAYTDGVLSRGLLDSKGNTAGAMYRIFISSVIRNLVIYGYCVWRQISEGDADEEAVYQVPNGQYASVRFDRDRLEWVADLYKTGEEDVDYEGADDDWNVIVLIPPLESRPDGFGARAYREAEFIETMKANQQARDTFNSRPAVFTTVDNQAFTTRGRAGGAGWLSSGLDIDPSTGLEGSTRSLDYGDLVAARAQMVRAAKDATVKDNTRAFRTGAGLPLGRFNAPDEDDGEDREHAEYAVSDGTKMSVVPHLTGPQQENLIVQRLRQNVFQIMGVPPQAIGESVSAERVGSNQRATSSALTMWEDRKRSVREALPVTETNGSWDDVVDTFTYERLLPILRTEAAVDLVSRTMGVDKSMIDAAKLSAFQEMMIGGGNRNNGVDRSTSNDPESSKKAERRKKTELDRDVTERARDAKAPA